MSETVTVLGAGMAGFGAAHRCRAEGARAVVFDKNPYHGGHTATFVGPGGFVFDDGPHISFTRDERMQELFANSVGGRYETIQARVNNYWRGYWIKHPAQCNLHGLPTDLVVRIVKEFVEAGREPVDAAGIRNYADWLAASFGRTFAETFPMRYGRKYHTAAAENMSTDWLGPRLYRPELAEVLRGAISPATPDVHYVSHFRYPSRNGFVSYLDGFRDDAELVLSHELVRLDPRARRLYFANGVERSYAALVSSLPLPELVRRIDGAPADVVEAAGRLACTTCVVVNLGIDRPDLSEHHWTYFYDDDYCFSRISFPHMLSPHNVPEGAGSIQTEIYFSAKYRPLDRRPEELVPEAIRDLRRCGLLREDDRILFQEARLVPYANVIFDLERAAAVGRVQAYLEELGIAWCGRYGEWGYLWTDESFTSGESAAQRALDRLGSPGNAGPRGRR